MKKDLILPIPLLVLISLLQGLCLLFLHQAIELKFWPSQSPQWLFALYCMAFIFPTSLLLSLNKDNVYIVLKFTVPLTLIGGMLGYYTGNQAIPLEHIRYDVLLYGFVVTMAIAAFKGLMYIQQYAHGERLSYSGLFRWSWRNYLTLSLSLLFTAILWCILLLWAALFNAIDISFFENLFKEKWFYYPATALANGFGIIIFRNLTHIIDTITRLQQALMKFLLVVLVFVSLLFLFTLPFTGLETLWDSGGSLLILWMQALILFFLNAVYQDEPKSRPYSICLHRFIMLGVFLLPVYSVISFYGLSIRVEQYGWSIDRCWAYLIWFMLALFSLGYVWGLVRFRDNWLEYLSRVNVVNGLVLFSLMLAVNSPILDFRKIVVNSQLARLSNGVIKMDDFDLRYFKRSLARPGYEGLQKIKDEYQEANRQVALKIDLLYSDPKSKIEENTDTFDSFRRTIYVMSDPPDGLIEAIYMEEIKNRWRMQNTQRNFLLEVELNNNDSREYLFVKQLRESETYLRLYHLENGEWVVSIVGEISDYNISYHGFYEALKNNDIHIESPRWQEFKIGDRHYQVR